MSDLVLSVDVYNDYAVLKNYYDVQGKINTIKTISVSALKDVFGERIMTSRIIPLWSIFHIEDEATFTILTCKESPNGFYPIKMEDVDYSMYYPYMYFLWRFNKEENMLRFVKTRIMTSFEYPHNNAKLFIPYIPNVYQDGNICWGYNDKFVFAGFDINDLHHIKRLEDIFLSGVHTNHVTDFHNIRPYNGKDFNKFADWSASPLVYKNSDKTISQLYEDSKNEKR